MKLMLDTHVHTLASGHAYSTLAEYVDEAKKKGLELIAQTDHGPAMPGGPHAFHIGNQRVLPKEMDGIRVLKGVEVNILDFEGRLDLEERYMKNLEFVLASLHDVCIYPGSREENTRALIGAMKNKYVDAIGHSGNPAFPIHIEAFVKAAKEHDVMIEINNSSFGKSRAGSRSNCEEIARLAKEYGVKMIAGSDSHVRYDLGVFNYALEVFERLEIPEELIMNTSKEKLLSHLRGKGKRV